MDGGPHVPSATGLSSSPSRRQKQPLPASLKISSFLAFQKTSQGSAVASPVRRKPLPPNASPLTSKPTSPDHDAATTNVAGKSLVKEATATSAPSANGQAVLLPPVEESPSLFVRDLDQYPRGHSPLLAQESAFPPPPPTPRVLPRKAVPPAGGHERTQSTQSRFTSASSSIDSTQRTPPKASDAMRRSQTMTLQPPTRPPPLRMDPPQRSFSTTSVDPKQPRTPGGSKLTSFFGWRGTTSPGAESSSTEISDNGHSPLPSPLNASPQTSAYSTRSIPQAIDTTKANVTTLAVSNSTQFGDLLPAKVALDPDLTTKVGQLEGELSEISIELAASIRRELELEDLLERYQENQGSTANNRTSDYFSDSGTSSVRAAHTDSNSRTEDIEKVKRRSEQEKAQLKVDLSQRWQDEVSRRKALESHIQLLENQVAQHRNEKLEVSNLSSKALELEAALEDARRRLAEERQIKENFEDLLTALRVDLEQHRNERDNLRDEIVPQLKSQLEGLESGAADAQKLTYDYARMEKEIQALKSENAILANARKMHMDMQQHQTRINSIAEEGTEASPRASIGLSRSNSLARAPSRTAMGRSGSLSRSNSISGKAPESRESLADRMKDVEGQRDALHKSLQMMVMRQKLMESEHEKRIKWLEMERDRAFQASPRKQGYEKEVKSLREEINHLRTRADDAMEQKWQCEKGLGGLKMDLDRAKQETASLRGLLQEHDISVPEELNASLEAAYKQLQQDQEQIKSHKQAAGSLEEEQRLAEQLRESTERSEKLASQIKQQLDTNQALRSRLAEAVGRGERDQHSSTGRINDLQNKLKRLEDALMVAQQQSETAVIKHEDEVRTLNEAHNNQLLRVKSGLRTPTSFSPRSPLSPMFGARSPRLDKTTSGPGVPLNQALKTEYLENRVVELEKALRDVDREMHDVVGKMNEAQMEVAELQSERDEALRQTRRLQADILAEREKVKALMT